MMFQEMWGLFFVQASAQLLNFQIVQQTTPRELHFIHFTTQEVPAVSLGVIDRRLSVPELFQIRRA